MNLWYIAPINRAFMKESHGHLKGEIVEIPVCACRGSMLPMIRVDNYDEVDSQAAKRCKLKDLPEELRHFVSEIDF